MPKPYTVVDPFNGSRPQPTMRGSFSVDRAAKHAADEPLRSVLGVSERGERLIKRGRRTVTGRRIA